MGVFVLLKSALSPVSETGRDEWALGKPLPIVVFEFSHLSSSRLEEGPLWSGCICADGLMVPWGTWPMEWGNGSQESGGSVAPGT